MIGAAPALADEGRYQSQHTTRERIVQRHESLAVLSLALKSAIRENDCNPGVAKQWHSKAELSSSMSSHGST
jgi:hypothetical protein